MIIGVAVAVFVCCMLLDRVRALLFRVTFDRHRGRLYDRLTARLAGEPR